MAFRDFDRDVNGDGHGQHAGVCIDHRPADRTERAGYGNCTYSGCNCPEYVGNADLCGNCGHNYSYHN